MANLSRIDDLIYFIADCGKFEYAQTINDGWKACNDDKFEKLEYLMNVYQSAKTSTWFKNQRYSAKVTFVGLFRNFMNILDPRSKAINVQKTTITQINGLLNGNKRKRM